MSFQLIEKYSIPEVPSASGIVYLQNTYFLIGDNANYLYQLNDNFKILRKIILFPSKHKAENDIIKKKHKSDLEALECISENEIIAFGSGSKSPQRDIFLRVQINEDIKIEKYTISSFYNYLKQHKALENSDLNIEALCYTNEKLYLFNRNKNVVFIVNYLDFINQLSEHVNDIDLHYKLFELPYIDKLQAGFSGASFCAKTNMFYLTASVENTSNAYDDGEILGSFIGTISLQDFENEKAIHWQLIPFDEKPVKVESICLVNTSPQKHTEIILCTDNDGKPSEILKGMLR